MGSNFSDTWDEVWAEYDARQDAAKPQSQPAVAWSVSAKPAKAAGRAGLAAKVAAGLLALSIGGYAAVPVLAAQSLSHAVSIEDAATIGSLMDWPAVQARMAEQLAAAAHALPPGRTAGLTGAGRDFLQGMAQEVSASLTTAEGLAEAMRRRLGLHGRGELAAPQVQPQGFTSARVVLASADGSDGSVSVTLELTDPLRLRWQVVAVELVD